LAYFPSPIRPLARFQATYEYALAFMASSKKITWEMGSFFNFKTFSRLYTLIQHCDRSPINASKRAHRAVVHWAAVTLVGSVRIRDLYMRPDGLTGSMQDQYRVHMGRMNSPLMFASLARRAISNACLILVLTTSVRSETRLSTTVGRIRRLNAVCSEEASSDWF